MTIAAGQHGMNAGTTGSITFGSAMAVGDSMVAVVFGVVGSRTVTRITFTDGTSNLDVTTPDTSELFSSTELYIFHIDNAAHAYTAFNVTWSSGVPTAGLAYLEVSGLNSPSLDNTNQGTAASTVSLATGALAASSEIIVSACGQIATGNGTTPTNYTLTDQSDISTSWHLMMAYRIVRSTATTNCVWARSTVTMGAVLGTYEALQSVEVGPIQVPSTAQQGVMRGATW